MWKFKETVTEKMADGVSLNIVGVDLITSGEDKGYYNPVTKSSNPYGGSGESIRSNYALGPNFVADLARIGIEGKISGLTFGLVNAILRLTQ